MPASSDTGFLPGPAGTQCRHHRRSGVASHILTRRADLVHTLSRPGDGPAPVTPVQSSANRPLDWWRNAAPDARRALVAAALGWGLDAFDVMLYALVLPALMADLGMDKTTAGQLGSLTLLASAAGGFAFGVAADRFGRKAALTASILVYSVFTAACGLARSALHLAVFRVLLGLGMGGEWASGAALVTETWPAEHRGKAMGLVQSSWAIGYGAAAVVTALVLPRFGWRAVFFVGVLPAIFTLWVRARVKEPDTWTRARGTRATASLRLLAGPLLGLTLLVTTMNACTLFAWWGFNLWIPSFLSLPPDRGGIGLQTTTMAIFVVVMQVGMWFGYVTFGFASDRFGRKRTYVTYLLLAAGLMSAYAWTRAPAALLALGPLVAFFGTGQFSGFGAVTAELYPTAIRATAQGLTYNAGRIVSAAAPLMVGSLADTRGFGVAFGLAASAFLCAAACWVWLPETKGRPLV
jgi:MFS family permease